MKLWVHMIKFKDSQLISQPSECNEFLSERDSNYREILIILGVSSHVEKLLEQAKPPICFGPFGLLSF